MRTTGFVDATLGYQILFFLGLYYFMHTRIDSIFPTDDIYGTLPKTGLYTDLLAKEMQEYNVPISLGTLSYIDLNTRTAEFTKSMIAGYGPVPAHFVHWFSGGDFTTPLNNINAITFSHNGVGTVIGYLPNTDSVPYYRLAYIDPPVKKDIVVTSKDRTHYSGNVPPDTIHGDIGYQTMDGYTLGILAGGPGLLSAGPMAAVEVFDLDSSVRLSSYNFKHFLGHAQIVSTTNQKRNLANYKLDWGDNVTTGTVASAAIGSGIGSIKIGSGIGGVTGTVVAATPTELANSISYGSIGDSYTMSIANNYYHNTKPTGNCNIRSAKELLLSVGDIPKLDKIHNEYDPTVDAIDGPPTEPVAAYTWTGPGNISQQYDYNTNLNKYLYKTYNVDRKAKIPLGSMIHQREDGSVIIMSKSGSCIEFNTEGDITISPKRDLILQPGRNMTALVPNHIDFVSQQNMTFRSTNDSIQFLAKLNNLLYAEGTTSIEAKRDVSIASEHNIHVTGKNMFNKLEKLYQLKCSTSLEDGTYKQLDYDSIKLLSKVTKITSNFTYLLADRSIYMKCSGLRYSGETFRFYASASGVLNAGGSPIRVNHVHTAGEILQSKGKVRKITKKPVEHFNYDIGIGVIADLQDLSYTAIEPQAGSVGAYYYAPWQIAGKGSWTTLTDPIMGKGDLFPVTSKLFTYDEGKLSETDWSNYKI